MVGGGLSGANLNSPLVAKDRSRGIVFLRPMEGRASVILRKLRVA